jgi:hypothetical protein
MNQTLTIDVAGISAQGAQDVIRELGQLDEEQKAIIRRVTHRLTEIGILAIGAGSEQLADLQNERNALMATLSSLGEEKAAAAGERIESFLWRLLDRAMDVALGKLGI